MPLDRVERTLALGHEPVSLDRPVAEEDKRPLGERLADTKAEVGQEMLLQQDLVDTRIGHSKGSLHGKLKSFGGISG